MTRPSGEDTEGATVVGTCRNGTERLGGERGNIAPQEGAVRNKEYIYILNI